MKRINILVLALLLAVAAIGLSSFSKGKKYSKYDYLITISTSFGDMKLILFDDTPIHKENFIRLAKEGKYNGSLFHRVIKNFMIQGGAIDHSDEPGWDTLSFEARTLPNEIMDKHKHGYGAVAAARVENPDKRSDISQFYIVDNPAGTHFLDNKYTVFGQLMVGYDVLAKIVNQPLNGSSPKKPIKMMVKVEKVKRANLIKFYGNEYTRFQSHNE